MLRRVLVLTVTNETSFPQVFSYILAAILSNSIAIGFMLALSLFDIIGNTRFFIVFLCMFSVLLTVALEETFHVITALALNKASAIRGVVIHTIAVKRIPIFCCKAAVRFSKTDITDSDYAIIAFGGPFCTLMVSLLLSLIIVLLCHTVGIPAMLFLLITPVISLLPSKYKAFESDGHIILRLGCWKMICKKFGAIMKAILKQTI